MQFCFYAVDFLFIITFRAEPHCYLLVKVGRYNECLDRFLQNTTPRVTQVPILFFYFYNFSENQCLGQAIF